MAVRWRNSRYPFSPSCRDVNVNPEVLWEHVFVGCLCPIQLSIQGTQIQVQKAPEKNRLFSFTPFGPSEHQPAPGFLEPPVDKNFACCPYGFGLHLQLGDVQIDVLRSSDHLMQLEGTSQPEL